MLINNFRLYKNIKHSVNIYFTFIKRFWRRNKIYIRPYIILSISNDVFFKILYYYETTTMRISEIFCVILNTINGNTALV